MLNRMRGATDKISDYQVGSVARTLIEGPATEIDQLYQQMFIGLREAIPVSTFLSFGFDTIPAAKANGTVSITRPAQATNALTIPAGTVFTATYGRRYVSRYEVVWAADTLSVVVPVEAETAGISGNAAAGVINGSPFFIEGEEIVGGTMSNGRDTETDGEREIRFADYIASLSRGTVAAVQYAAYQARLIADGVTTEYVTRVGVVDLPGFVRLYLYSSIGLPSTDLLAAGQRIIDGYRDETGKKIPGYRAAGVRIDVLSMVEVPVTFSIAVEMMPGYTLSETLRLQMVEVIEQEILAVESGGTLYVGTLADRVLAMPGVLRCVPGNTENFICAESEALVPGTITITSI